MTMTTKEFVSQFHSLTGITVGQKRKTLFLLLRNFDGTESADLTPTNLLEEKFKVDFLIYFKRVPELLQYLKSENPESVGRIFKMGSWFFEEAFKNFTGKKLMTELFPYVSFNVKVKLLNKLSEILDDVQQADDIFNNVNDIYGLHLASKILPACSYDVIIRALNEVKLPPKQLLLIIKKYPEKRTALLETLKKFNLEKHCNSILEYLKKTDLPTFLELHQKRKLSQKLGWRITNKFVKSNKDAVIADPNVYYKILHNKQIAKSLRSDFFELFKNLFPAELKNFCSARKSLTGKLKVLPRRLNALELYTSAFKSRYGTEIWDHPELVTIHLLKMLNPSERDKRIKDESRSSSVTEDEWKSLHNTKISIPFLKKRISLTSDIKTRADLVGFLVDTCKFNEDRQALSSVCKYVLSKHRNDHITVRLAFLRHVNDNFVLEKLEDEQWTPINEFIQIFRMNGESFYNDDLFKEKYIHYRLRNKLPIKDQLNDWLLDGLSNMNLITSEPELERVCLQEIWEIISNLAKDDLFVNYLISAFNFNCRNLNNQLPLFVYSRAIEILKQNISNYVWDHQVYNLIVYFLNNVEKEEKPQYLKLLLFVSNNYSEINILYNLLESEPLLILQNIEDVVFLLLKSRNKHKAKLFKKLRFYSHLNIPQTAARCCLNYKNYSTKRHLSQNNDFEESAFAAVCILMEPESFACLYDLYPDEPRACADKTKFKKQKCFCFNLRNVYPASEVLPLILKFCKGDYFKLVLGSLYSVCGNLNEDKLIPILDELATRPVSVQKHRLHLTFRYGNKKCIYRTIDAFMEIKIHASVRKFLLKAVFNFFSKNPSDYHWNIVKRSVITVDESDKEALDLFSQIDKIPLDYLARYQMFAWDILEKFPNPEGVLDTKRTSLLNSVRFDEYQVLLNEFCRNIIGSNLFRSDDLDAFQASIQSLACRYIICCSKKEETRERLEYVFSMFRYYVNNRWFSRLYRDKARSNCTQFLNIFCSEFLNNHSYDKDILQNFFDLWSGLLKPHEAFGDYSYLKFTLMYMERCSLQELSKKFLKFCTELTSIYGLVVLEMVFNSFNKFIDAFFKRGNEEYESNLYEFISHLMNASESDTCMLMATLLLQNNTSFENSVEQNKIIEALESKKNRIVHLFLYRYIRGKTTLHYY